jgi:hypothetical protein
MVASRSTISQHRGILIGFKDKQQGEMKRIVNVVLGMYGTDFGEKIFSGYVYQKKGVIYKRGFALPPLFPLGVCGVFHVKPFPLSPFPFPSKKEWKKKVKEKVAPHSSPPFLFPL